MIWATPMNPFNRSTIEDHVFLHPVSMLLGTKFDVICHHFMVCLYVLNIRVNDSGSLGLGHGWLNFLVWVLHLIQAYCYGNSKAGMKGAITVVLGFFAGFFYLPLKYEFIYLFYRYKDLILFLSLKIYCRFLFDFTKQSLFNFVFLCLFYFGRKEP